MQGLGSQEPPAFRQLLREISTLLCYEATRDLALEPVEIETPVSKTRGVKLSGKKLVFAPILRAGVGLLEGMLDLVPAARVAHIGLYRDPATLVAVEYYFKAPEKLDERVIIVIDPMLATGNSAVAAVDRLKKTHPRSIRFVCLVTCPEGLKTFHDAHPDVPVYTPAIDRGLNDHGYIVPGLGDAGDRIFGTK